MIPVDSAEARELRETAEAGAVPALTHSVGCRDGVRRMDTTGRPRPCLACRPHLARAYCRSCRATPGACTYARREGRTPCCPVCGPRTAAPTPKGPADVIGHQTQDTPVVMRCAAKDCPQYMSARPEHLANLLAGGPWRCPDHSSTHPPTKEP